MQAPVVVVVQLENTLEPHNFEAHTFTEIKHWLNVVLAI